MSDVACNNEAIREQITDKWTGKSCTLNGLPAKVVGRQLRFAQIATQQYRVEFAWETVDAIMKRDQKFIS
jgi:hypothetical protein